MLDVHAQAQSFLLPAVFVSILLFFIPLGLFLAWRKNHFLKKTGSGFFAAGLAGLVASSITYVMMVLFCRPPVHQAVESHATNLEEFLREIVRAAAPEMLYHLSFILDPIIYGLVASGVAFFIGFCFSDRLKLRRRFSK